MAGQSKKLINAAVIVAALGYFVDIFDLLLFSIVRTPSLKSFGLSEAEVLEKGLLLQNAQMIGMLLGGIAWGILGDKRGRLSVLFGSIILYSIANIANGYVHSVEAYAVWRFLAGVGLAGELGAGITLVSEVLPKEVRGYGTMIVATVGVSGAVFGGFVSEMFDWRTTYLIGGGLGVCLLFLRVAVAESGMFHQIRKTQATRGNFLMLFQSRGNFFKYLNCILIGVPIWFVIGILMTLSPEFAKALGITGTVTAGRAVMFCYSGLIFGDFFSGYLSQTLQSRTKIVRAFLLLTTLGVLIYFLALHGASDLAFYFVCAFLGFGSGYWAIFVTIAAEQFGTNLRATVTTTVPNFVRGSVVPLTFLFKFAKTQLPILPAAGVVGAAALLIAFVSAVFLKETFGKDLNYIEG